MKSIEKKQVYTIIVVLFNPKKMDKIRIKNYAKKIEKLILIDNSEENNSIEWIKEIDNAEYFWMGNNLGIASALNFGCRIAKQQGYDYVLTMDQDSEFGTEELTFKILELIKEMEMKSIVMVGVINKIENNQEKIIYAESFITSGSLLKISSWHEVQGFTEKLFIDQVDHDFCFKLRRGGFKIGVSNILPILNIVGSPSSTNFFNKKIVTSNHSWIRRYYIVRNSLYLRREFPEYSKSLIKFYKDIIEMVILIVLFEEDKTKKILAMISGLIDYYRGKFGSYYNNQW